MVENSTSSTEAPPSALPSASEYAAMIRGRNWRIWLAGLFLSALSAVLFVGLGVNNLVAPLVMLVAVATPFVVWRYNTIILYFVYICVCLFELFPIDAPDSITDRVPIFWNVNTIVQRLAGVDFHDIPVNLLELFILVAGSMSLVRSVFTGTTRLRLGSLFWPLLGYAGFVIFGEIHGMMTGGDFKISLQEIRSQFYFLLAYLMAVNTIRDRRHVHAILWMGVVCIGLKGILYTFRRYVTMHGLPLPDQGVGSHEEAFFFDAFGVQLLVLLVCGLHPRMRMVMWCLLPVVLLGNLACNRRAATAAMILVLPTLLIGAYQALPERRKVIRNVAIALVVGIFVYYQAFKNSGSIYAQPARAIKSQFTPDPRDASSNQYRQAEEQDLYATIKLDPVWGYGYGKRMLHAVPIADISGAYEWWDVMTHNQILWVWMRVGTIGFVVFWIMMCSIVLKAGELIRSEADREVKALAIMAMLFVGQLLMFGLLDLQISNMRDMLFVGFWAGVLAAAPTLPGRTDAPEFLPAPTDLVPRRASR